jgi:hypothetical protein
MTDTQSRVKINGDLTEPFPVMQGLKQGDSIAPTLFNIALEFVIRNIQQNNNPIIYIQSTQIVGYADDLNIVSRNLPALHETFDLLEERAKDVGLEINSAKTKLMKQSRTPQTLPSAIQFKDHYNIEVVNDFVYLGSNITNTNDEHSEIMRRITAANKTFFSLLPILKSRSVHRKTKLTLYKTMIRTVMAYGCEARTLTVRDAETIDRFERRVLRRDQCGKAIYGELGTMRSYTVC